MTLTDEERAELEARFNAEAEAEHARRGESRTRPRAKTEDREEDVKNAEIAALRNLTREKFFSERGYVRYKDSRGTISWLLPDEAARRKKRRASGKPEHRSNPAPSRFATVGLVLGVLVLAALVGLILGSR